MKYLLSILFFLFLGIEADAKGFSDNFKSENHHWNLGFHFGGIGQNRRFRNACIRGKYYYLWILF